VFRNSPPPKGVTLTEARRNVLVSELVVFDALLLFDSRGETRIPEVAREPYPQREKSLGTLARDFAFSYISKARFLSLKSDRVQ